MRRPAAVVVGAVTLAACAAATQGVQFTTTSQPRQAATCAEAVLDSLGYRILRRDLADGLIEAQKLVAAREAGATEVQVFRAGDFIRVQLEKKTDAGSTMKLTTQRVTELRTAAGPRTEYGAGRASGEADMQVVATQCAKAGEGTAPASK